VLILGCGYVGSALGAEMAKRGHEVFVVRRTVANQVELSGLGIHPLKADITNLADLQTLPGPFDWVVNTVSSTKGGVEEYRRVYLHGMRNLIDWLGPAPPQRFLYTSSTSVYGQADGSRVEENSPTEPVNETGRILLETEQLLADADLPSVILRVAGIYGPGRGYWLQRYLRGEAKVEGAGERILNMIHRDDVVGIIIAALERSRPGQIYNAVDDEPVTQIELFRWLSATLGRPMPPRAEEAGEGVRKRGFTNKSVSNQKLRSELRYEFKYPTFREGFTAEIKLRASQAMDG